VAVFIIRDIPGGLGCSLLMTDYVTVDGMAGDPASGDFSPRTIGHELGHACNLFPHECTIENEENLMAVPSACPEDSVPPPPEADRINPRISNIQAILIRASKHVTYF
jgi:hypothetical protein